MREGEPPRVGQGRHGVVFERLYLKVMQGVGEEGKPSKTCKVEGRALVVLVPTPLSRGLKHFRPLLRHA